MLGFSKHAIQLALLTLLLHREALSSPCTWKDLTWEAADVQEPPLRDSPDDEALAEKEAPEATATTSWRAWFRDSIQLLATKVDSRAALGGGDNDSPPADNSSSSVDGGSASPSLPPEEEVPLAPALTLVLPAACSSLSLDGQNVTESHMVALATALEGYPGSISALTLRNSHTGDAGAAVLAKTLGRLPGLGSLNLEGNGIGDAGAAALAASIAGEEEGGGTSLRYLILESNSIGNDGARALASAFTSPKCQLEVVFLQQNLVTDEGADCLVESLEENFRLRTLMLWGNAVNPRVHEQLRELLALGPQGRKSRVGDGTHTRGRVSTEEVALEVSADGEHRKDVKEGAEAEVNRREIADAEIADADADADRRQHEYGVDDMESKECSCDAPVARDGEMENQETPKQFLAFLFLLSHIGKEPAEIEERELGHDSAHECVDAGSDDSAVESEMCFISEIEEMEPQPAQFVLDPIVAMLAISCVAMSLLFHCILRTNPAAEIVRELQARIDDSQNRCVVLQGRLDAARNQHQVELSQALEQQHEARINGTFSPARSINPVFLQYEENTTPPSIELSHAFSPEQSMTSTEAPTSSFTWSRDSAVPSTAPSPPQEIHTGTQFQAPRMRV